MKQLALELSPIPAPTLANFVPGGNGELLRAIADMLTGFERFIYLWGEVGSGRSHLLQAAVAGARERGLRAAYVGDARLPQTLEETQLLAVDDVERLDADGQIALFALYNRIKEGDGCLLAAGARPIAQLGLRADLATRLGWGLVYQVHGLTDAEKTAAMEHHAIGRGFRLPPEVSAHLLKHWQRDLPALLTVVGALDRYSLERKRPVTLQLLRDFLKEPRP
jgi:DnaA family protein